MNAELEGVTKRAPAALRGEAAAHGVMAAIRSGNAKPDALSDAWAGLRSDRHAMQGFGRAIQKALESATAAKRAG